MPPLHLDEQTHNFASNTFDTTGCTQAEIDVALRSLLPTSVLSFYTDDFSTFNMGTPRHAPAPFGPPFTPPFRASPLTTSHLRAAETQFDKANERASIVLAVNQDRADSRSDTPRPLFDAAVNLPHGPLLYLHTRVPVTDNVRKAIGQSGVAGKKRGREGAEKENATPAGKKGSNRIQFSANDLIHLARVDLKPFLAPHNSKGQIWQLVTETLVDQGFRHLDVRADTVQHRVEALVAFKKDPSKNKKLANLIGEGTSAGVIIAALLERLEDQHDQFAS
ncbi:hypothetical protein B0H19DRAFT_1273571 [Mycena capillaripes]|nr:hypothetical protein B0H19DRAFT_1273571 [Mycena capillaripes]